MKARAFDFVVHSVSDMDRALDFYWNILGFPITSRPAPHWAELAVGDDALVIAVPAPEWAPPPRQAHEVLDGRSGLVRRCGRCAVEHSG